MKYEIEQIDGTSISNKYHLSSLVSKVLTKANLDDSKILEILDTDDTLSTSKSKCVTEACVRILKAKENKEKVFVGGDYDTDGICSTAIMKDILDKLEIENGYYIPNRFKEGYGLSGKTVELAYKKGYTLIITVDNGVKAFDAIEKANELGIDIIVTDHHQIDKEVNATIVVHPNYMEKEYANLSGAGVVLELSRNLLGEIDKHTALACIALIGDVMPFWLETRKIIRKGCKLIQKGVLPSVSSLLSKGEVDETAIAFQVVPKLNSVARLKDESNVNTLVPFLLSDNLKVISDYKTALNKVNDKRKALSSAMVSKAETLIDHDKSMLVIYDDSFDEGLAGLVAGRIAATQKKPCIILTSGEEKIKASGRSIPGFNLFEFFNVGFDEFTEFGGHEQAVGFSFNKDDLDRVKEKILTKFESLSTNSEAVDKVIALEDLDITIDAIEDLNMLKPIPKEFNKLKFGVKYPYITNVQHYDKVTKYTFSNGLDGVLFSYQKVNALDNPTRVIGTLAINEFRGKKTPQILIEYMD